MEIYGSQKPIILNNDNTEARQQIEVCALKGKKMLNPIIDWSEEDVWNFIRKYRAPYCELYDQGFCRLGCIGCPLASVKNREREFLRYLKYREAYIRTFDRMVQVRTASGKTTGDWRDGRSVFRWWMYGNGKKEKQTEGQMEMEDFIDMAA